MENVSAPAQLLRDVLPREFFHEFLDTRAATMLDCVVATEVSRFNNNWRRWPGPHQNVMNWWILADGRNVGWNEGDRGWSFPVFGRKTRNDA